MLPKATGTSLRGGRSTGKGFKLALPEPTIKKSSSTSSGSPTQVGSSTQKSKIEGSSTQIVTIKPESSTQETPKPATAKQTKADYVWSVQTLQGLQEMGLAKLPKLTKKTWADIASESNDDSEIDLQSMIQNSKQSKTLINPKGKQVLSQQKPPPPKNANSYIYKNKFSTVLQMEPKFWDKNPFKVTSKAFPIGFHFRPNATNKTRIFYEFILIETNSMSIKHFEDTNDPNLNTHSTIQISKVLQPRQFGTNLN